MATNPRQTDPRETGPRETDPRSTPSPLPATIGRWIKTDCGRARYLELAARPGVLARLRLGWFVLVAALRDLPLPAAPPERDGPPG